MQYLILNIIRPHLTPTFKSDMFTPAAGSQLQHATLHAYMSQRSKLSFYICKT